MLVVGGGEQPLSKRDSERAVSELAQAEAIYESLESPLPRRAAQIRELRAALAEPS